MDMTISIIVAASTNNVIGKNNKLLWHLPNDLKFFKNTTWAMPVIMGRKTYESIAGGPLPGRFNFVISRQQDWDPHNDKVTPALSLQAAIESAQKTDCKEVFILGGGQVYEEAMPVTNKIYMTRVHAIVEGDTYFPVINEELWQLVSRADFPADEKHAYAYSFELWRRK